jgi:hypothetical protein
MTLTSGRFVRMSCDVKWRKVWYWAIVLWRQTGIRRHTMERLPVVKNASLAFVILTSVAFPALAGPPADIDGCIKLSAETARGAKIQSEAEYIKFHSKLLDLDAACGARDFVGAEKIAADIRAAFPAK